MSTVLTDPSQAVDITILSDGGKVWTRTVTATIERYGGTGLRVTLGKEAIDIAELVASKMRGNAVSRECKTRYGQWDGDCPEDHRLGSYGELAVSIATGLPWVVSFDLKGEKPPDIGNHIEVKTTRYRDAIFKVGKHEPTDRVYVLATATPPENVVMIHGWMLGSEIKQPKFWRDSVWPFQDRRKGYAVHKSELHDLCEMPDGGNLWLYAMPGELVVEPELEQARANGFMF